MNPDASTAHLAEGRSSVIPMPQRITQESRREAFDLAVRSLPDDIVFVEGIPKTSVGKFDKKVLREDFKSYRLPAT